MITLVSAPRLETLRADYPLAIARLEADRRGFAIELASAKTRKARAEVLERARARLFGALRDELLPAWVGTKWAFEGTSAVPGEGEIACGMFVGTIFAHAGYPVDRIALGRLASEKIALTLTREKNLRRWSDTPVSEIERVLAEWGEGIYMVGLDRHAALILVDAKGVPTLVHSSYYAQQSVMFEPLDGENPFRASRYRVIAKLLDDEMITHWLD